MGWFVACIAVWVVLSNVLRATIVYRLHTYETALYEQIGSPLAIGRFFQFLRPLSARIASGDQRALGHGVPALVTAIRALDVLFCVSAFVFLAVSMLGS
jgi:hypothetical protein